ncbi:DUF7824 domain-containing protein, partial [Streptomyces toxytricini]|uniref:DUF7824 domain-containing protein n=1 Tax=Streptomyces toxytricini TaxID=67369 RepID=UPI003420D697
MEPRGEAELAVELRFLHARRRTVEEARGDGSFAPVPELRLPDRVLVPWDEGTEETVRMSVPVSDLEAGMVELPFARPAAEEAEPVTDADGRQAGRLVRRAERLDGVLRLRAEQLDLPYRALKLTATVHNTSDWEPPPGAGREDALARSLVAAHLPARLAEDGLLDRSVLADGCTARLLRGGRPAHLSFYLDLLQALDLTQDEQQARTGDWIAMAGDAPSPLAGHAQGILAGLAEAGRLTAEQLAEMSAAVLFRPEKKLVRAQLVLLGKALRRSPDDRAVLLPAAAAAFGHADTALQERALRLVAAHLRPEDDALRAELAGQAGLLGPVHRRTAADLLGAAAGDAAAGPCEDVLPPAPERRRTAPAADLSLAATVELVAALAHARQPDPAEFETALDALVRHAHRDRPALAAALHPALADRRWLQADGWTDPEWFEGVELVAATVLGCVRAVDLRTAGSRRGVGYPHDCVHAALGAVTTARIREAAARILTDPLPFLLATPTWDTGTLEPLELVARLAEYARLGAAPAPADFAQALLRVRRDPEAAAAASALGTAEGGRLAAWLASAGEPPRTARRVQEPASAASRLGWDRTRETVPRIVVELPERPALQDGSFPAEFRRLGRPYADTGRRCYHWSGYELGQHPVMPEDRETQAVWLLPALTACATVGER